MTADRQATPTLDGMRLPAVVTTMTCCCTECGKAEQWSRQGMTVTAPNPWCVWWANSMSNLLRSIVECGAELRESPGEGNLAFCSLECMDAWAHRMISPGFRALTLIHLGGGKVVIEAARSRKGLLRRGG